MKRERENAVLCHRRCDFLRFTATEVNPCAKFASQEVALLFTDLRNIPPLVLRGNNLYMDAAHKHHLM